MRERLLNAAGRGVVAVLLCLLVLPLAVVVATAFDASGAVAFPPRGLSTRWFSALLASSTWLQALLNSLVVATGTSALSTAVGVAAALGVRQLDEGRRRAVVALTVLPLLVPGVIIGVTTLTLFSQFGLQQSYVALVLAHSLWATPLAFSVIQASFARFDWQLHEAALDLGATPIRAFTGVVAPNVRAGLAVAALVAFVVSLQEFVIALFLSGPDTRTVPVAAWNSLRQSLDPVVSVVSALLLVAVVCLVAVVGALAGVGRFASDL